ncbi:hypothetical protein [Parvularcula sp. LCG005]|uniref:hypothetical protein n=1 Tax=Parvularcula sp. LCG005 TaxID=3078805 RepID=UPI002942DDA5|nr:hypothetical protein [Parvularcula sp. LCG005]WOI51963.1 hypothetical protein RUI03_07315 [Parvularcula sp. LCG005]
MTETANTPLAMKFATWCKRQHGSADDVTPERFKREMLDERARHMDWVLNAFEPSTRQYNDPAYAVTVALSSLAQAIELVGLTHGGEEYTNSQRTTLKAMMYGAACQHEFSLFGTEHLKQFFTLNIQDNFAYIGDDFAKWLASEMGDDDHEGDADAFAEYPPPPSNRGGWHLI